jgi:hypothetical protein
VAAVTTVKQDFQNSSGPWYKPWLLMMLELWSRGVLDQTSKLKSGYSTAEANCTTAVVGADRT